MPRPTPQHWRRGEIMTDAFQLASLYPVLPEIVLAIGAMLLLMYGAWAGDDATNSVSWAAVVLLVVAGVLVVYSPAGVAFGGSFVVDGFARFLKILALIGSAVTVILSLEFLHPVPRRRFEYAVLILLATTG